MTISTDVNLPKSFRAVFPDRCVACGVEHPDGSFRAGTNAIGWWTLAFWSFGPRFSVDVPACRPCRDRMRRQRWLRLAVTVVVVLIGVGVGFSVLQWYDGPLKRWLVLAVALVCLVPVFLWETFFPPPIDLTAYSATVDYEFRDSAYAEEFAALNLIDPEEEPA
jgi:hypothetical protein